ncbi:MAG: hypothetical protein LQ341_004640, partial [Variospora aurantia]
MAALNKIAPTSPSRQHPNETETSIANALYDLESNIPDMKSALRPLQFVSAREVSQMVSRFTRLQKYFSVFIRQLSSSSFNTNSGLIREKKGWDLRATMKTRTLTHTQFCRSTSATARKQSSSSCPSPSSPASTKFNNGTAPSLLLSQPPTPNIPSSLSLVSSQLTNIPSPDSLTRELEKKFSDRHVLILASRRILPRPKRSARSRTSQTQKRPHSRTLTAVHDAILHDVVYPVEIVGKRTRTREDGSKVLKVILDEKERGG